MASRKVQAKIARLLQDKTLGARYRKTNEMGYRTRQNKAVKNYLKATKTSPVMAATEKGGNIRKKAAQDIKSIRYAHAKNREHQKAGVGFGAGEYKSPMRG